MSVSFQKFRKYIRSPADLWLFLCVAWWIAILPILLKKNPLDKLVMKFSGNKGKSITDRDKLGVYVNWWLNRKILMFRPTCLKRSLVMFKFLRESGHPAIIHYGIRKENGHNDGHSWLTLDGEPLPPDGETACLYNETFRYPAVEGA